MASILRSPSRSARPTHLEAARNLMSRAFEGDFSDEDWDHSLGGWHIFAVDGADVVSHAAIVPRTLHVGRRVIAAGYVEAVATDPERQGTGLGTAVMREAASLIRAGFEMGALSSGLGDFYRRLGWERWRGPTYVRAEAGLLRTAEDDDGVMVLRFGPSLDVDLTAPISCETRPGDVW